MINQYPAGTIVIVRRPSVRGWPQDSIKGRVVGYTATGRVKIDTGVGIRVFAAHNIISRCYLAPRV